MLQTMGKKETHKKRVNYENEHVHQSFGVSFRMPKQILKHFGPWQNHPKQGLILLFQLKLMYGIKFTVHTCKQMLICLFPNWWNFIHNGSKAFLWKATTGLLWFWHIIFQHGMHFIFILCFFPNLCRCRYLYNLK